MWRDIGKFGFVSRFKQPKMSPVILSSLGRNWLLKMPTVGWTTARDQNESESEMYLRIEVSAHARRGSNI